MNDGAAAVVLASEEALAERPGLSPLARVVAFEAVGCDPKIKGIGAAYAVEALLRRTGIKLEHIEIVEIIEVS